MPIDPKVKDIMNPHYHWRSQEASESSAILRPMKTFSTLWDPLNDRLSWRDHGHSLKRLLKVRKSLTKWVEGSEIFMDLQRIGERTILYLTNVLFNYWRFPAIVNAPEFVLGHCGWQCRAKKSVYQLGQDYLPSVTRYVERGNDLAGSIGSDLFSSCELSGAF